MVVYFIQASVLHSKTNAKFWPILAILSQIYAMFGVIFTIVVKHADVVCAIFRLAVLFFAGVRASTVFFIL